MSGSTAPPPHGQLAALATSMVVTIAAGVALWLAFRPACAGQPQMLLILGGTYSVLAIGTYFWLARRGELRKQLTPARGDITVGALCALGLYMFATLGYLVLTPQGSPREPWMMRLYLQVGDPRLSAAFQIGLAVLAVAAVEEIVWRGWVMGVLSAAYGEPRGWLVSSALYAGAHLPTVIRLGDPAVGPNPLVVLAALGCGLVWGLLAWRFGRLAPSVVAHALFTWAVVEYPLWRM